MLKKAVVSLSEVVTKYSNFVSFPIFLNGRRLNTLQVSVSDSVVLSFTQCYGINTAAWHHHVVKANKHEVSSWFLMIFNQQGSCRCWKFLNFNVVFFKVWKVLGFWTRTLNQTCHFYWSSDLFFPHFFMWTLSPQTLLNISNRFMFYLNFLSAHIVIILSEIFYFKYLEYNSQWMCLIHFFCWDIPYCES